MKTQAIHLTASLLLTASPLVLSDTAADQPRLRYSNPSGSASFSITHKIRAGKRDTRAGRKFSIDMDLNNVSGDTMITIKQAKGSYTAHEMTQRLPASKLTGQSFALSAVDNGQTLQRKDPGKDLEIPVGQIIGADYPIGLALVDILPVLPEGPVEVGTTWTTTKDTRSLEAWAWVIGSLRSEHSVTAIEQKNGHTVVSVTSKGQALLGNGEAGIEYSGDGELSRSSKWKFDASDGRLLSLSMRQNTSGINSLPQGEISVNQFTGIEYSTSD